MNPKSKIFLAGMFLAAAGTTVCRVQAQGTISTSATLTETGVAGSEYEYTLTVQNTGTVPIDAVWYGWIPGAFDLPSAPTGIVAMSGWSGSDFANSIQFQDDSVNSSSSTPGTSPIEPGDSGTFTFETTDDPIAMTTGTTGGVPTGDSIAYNAPGPMQGFEGTSPGIGSEYFQPTLSTVPEPATWSLLVPGALVLVARSRKFRAWAL